MGFFVQCMQNMFYIIISYTVGRSEKNWFIDEMSQKNLQTMTQIIRFASTRKALSLWYESFNDDQWLSTWSCVRKKQNRPK